MGVNRDKVLAAAQKHVRKGNWDRAIREYEKVIEDDPSDVRSQLKIADLYVKLEDFEEALMAYRRVADYYAADDIYEKAVAVYKQALRIAPESAPLHRDLGEAYFRLGRLKDAVRVLHKAQKIYKSEGNGAAQRDVLERMVRIDPEDVGLKIQLAERYEKQQMRAEALGLFREAAAQLAEEGRIDEWTQVCERIVYLDQEDLELRKEIVHKYLDRRDDKHALKHLQFCFKANPQDVETLQMLGMTFQRLGNTDKSVLVFKELANAFQRRGQRRRALDAYRRILDMRPEDREARAAVGENLTDSGSIPGLQDTGSLEKETRTEDALEGVEFLDEEIGFLEAEDEVRAVASASSSADFDSFARDAVRSIEADARLSEIEEYPEYRGEIAEEPAADLTDQIVAIEEDVPTEEKARREVTQLLTESEVFLKYGLLDRAEDVITRAVALDPSSLEAREQMSQLLQKQGDLGGAADEFLEMARIARTSPTAAARYIARARELADDTSRVDDVAAALGVSGVEYEEPVDELSVEFIEEISEGLEEASKSYGDDSDLSAEPGAGEVLFLEEEEVEFLVEDELEGGLEDELEAELGFLDEQPLDATSQELPILDETEHDIPVMDDTLQEVDVVEDTDLSVPTHVDIAEGMEIDDAEMLDIDFDDMAFDESELEVLESSAESDDFEFELSDDDANAMFDELFGPSSAESEEERGIGAETSDEQLEEIDFYIAQGMVSEAEDALETLEEESPGHSGIAVRRTRIAAARSGGGEPDRASASNEFGSESLSRRFTPGSAGHTAAVRQLLEPNEVVNTNLELGTTYKEMGLFEEAIEEFEQALDDPEAAAAAMYQIALCQIELGEENDAQAALSELAADQTAPEQLRKVAGDKLAELQRAGA